MAKKTYSFPFDAKTLQEDFRRHFGVSPDRYIDMSLSVVCRRYMLDLLKFDVLLHVRFGNYDSGNDSISMQDLISREYGEDAERLVNALI